MMKQGAQNTPWRHEHTWTPERKIDFVCDWFDLSVSLDCMSAEYGVAIYQINTVRARLGCPTRQVIRANQSSVIRLSEAA